MGWIFIILLVIFIVAAAGSQGFWEQFDLF